MSTTSIRHSLLVLLLVLLATTFLSTQAFVVPTSPLRQRHTNQRTSNLKMMLTLPPEAPQSFLTTSSNLLIAASRFIKDVPTTLTDMSESVTPDGGGAVTSYTLPDGSYTNAGDVAEVCLCMSVCMSAYLLLRVFWSSYTHISYIHRRSTTGSAPTFPRLTMLWHSPWSSCLSLGSNNSPWAMSLMKKRNRSPPRGQ